MRAALADGKRLRAALAFIVLALIAVNLALMQIPVAHSSDSDKPGAESSGTISAGNSILDIHVEDQPFSWGFGTYTITTGSSHPNPSRNVFYSYPEGAAFPATTYNTIHVTDTMRDYVTMNWATPIPDPGYSTVLLDSYATSTMSTPTMIASSWTTIENLDVAQEIELVGTTVADTLVRVTTRVSNNDAYPHTVGIRFEWDLMIDGWDGAWIRPWIDSLTPGTWLDTETEWTSPGFQFWETSNMPVSLFSVYGSISSLPEATPPDRFTYAHWGTATYYAYGYTPSGIVIGAEEPSIGGQYDSCVLYYWDPTTIEPGESREVTAYVTTFITAITPIPATVDIDPDKLNLKSNGEWITAYIELPEGFNVSEIVLDTVHLDGIQAVTDPTYGFVTDPTSYLVDHDQDGLLERMVKFDRATVRDLSTGMPDYTTGEKFFDLPLTVTGQLADGTSFEGSDNIVVIHN